jgi:hypothetical protein
MKSKVDGIFITMVISAYLSLGSEHVDTFSVRLYWRERTYFACSGLWVLGKQLSKIRIELLRSHHNRFVVRRLLTGFILSLVLGTEPPIFCRMVSTTAMRTLGMLLGHSRFVFCLVLLVLTLVRLSIVATFSFTAFGFECLLNFQFLEVVDSALKIKLIKFNIRTKDNCLPFFRLCLVEDANQFGIRQFTRFRLTFFTWKVRQVII